MQPFQIWLEGYFSNESEKAVPQLLATVQATSFQNACNKQYDGDPNYSRDTLTISGYRLFPTKDEAKLHSPNWTDPYTNQKAW